MAGATGAAGAGAELAGVAEAELLLDESLDVEEVDELDESELELVDVVDDAPRASFL